MHSHVARLIANGGRRRRLLRREFFPSRRPIGSSFKRSLSAARSFHATSHQSYRASSASLHSALAEQEEEDPYIERFTAASLSQMLPNVSPSRGLSSLDLELGEGSAWEDTWYSQHEASELEEEEDPELPWSSGDVRPPPPQTTTRGPRRRKKSLEELLEKFDPQLPPATNDPEELQIWLECETHQEAVRRYQSMVDGARNRKDFSSLSVMQRQVLHWFEPLKFEIQTLQKMYILKQWHSKKNEGKQRMENRKSYSKIGPYLCALSPEKLAVILAHEAVRHALTRGGRNGKEGVTLVSAAQRIGEAVEEELAVHRLLLNRFKESSSQRDEENEAISSFARESAAIEAAPPTDHSVSEQSDGPATEEEDSLDDTHKWDYAASHLNAYLDEIKEQNPQAKKRNVVYKAIRRARQITEKDEEWSKAEKVQLGAALLRVLLDKASFREDGKSELAFTYEKRWVGEKKIQAFLVMNERLREMIVSDEQNSFGPNNIKLQPMVIPPTPWTAAESGGFRMVKVDLMRYHGCRTQMEAMKNADLSTLFDGLNALGRVKWRINERLLDVAKRCWKENIALGDIPTRTNYELPPAPVEPLRSSSGEQLDNGTTPDDFKAEYRRYRDAVAKYNRIRQRNMDLNSLRCSAILKLDQAEKFKQFDEIYFPYNVDFRGRAYPVPPHLSIVGSDLCRGMLMFADGKPLGSRGLYWLKVHLANLAGYDKATFDDRAKFVDENMDKVRESAEDPFAGDRWWMSLEDPFQALAASVEIINAIDSGDPASYMCSLAVHMDGSCNGLQHYAALGRDRVGGKAVNLCAAEEPQDVYLGVMHEVIRRVADEAGRQLDFDTSDPSSLKGAKKKQFEEHNAAKLVNGLIDRGVVKRTVMTSVYGVTYIGARQQIQEKIQSKLEDQGHDIDEMEREVFRACGYLARVTMEAIGELFTGAKGTMDWLTTCARMIVQHGYPVAWVSPIGVPAIQPYRQNKSAVVVTLLQNVTLASDRDNLPIHKQRQVSAFPPNYIHSLDSSHMLLTALEMDRRGLTFSAVHDSFWTHPCDVDEMNAALRDVFVELYEQPLLETLKETWETRYPDLKFPDLPKRGDLDLNEVKNSEYFFQ